MAGGEVTFPSYVPNFAGGGSAPVNPAANPVSLTASRSLAASDLQKVVRLFGYTLNLSDPGSSGEIIVVGPGSVAGAIAYTLKSNERLEVMLIDGVFSANVNKSVSPDQAAADAASQAAAIAAAAADATAKSDAAAAAAISAAAADATTKANAAEAGAISIADADATSKADAAQAAAEAAAAADATSKADAAQAAAEVAAAADATSKADAAQAAAVAAAAADATTKSNNAQAAAIAAAEADATSKADAAQAAAEVAAAADATSKADAAQAAAVAAAAADASTKANAAEAAAAADATGKAAAAQSAAIAAASADVAARAVRYDAAQSLSAAAKVQALKNLGLASKNNYSAIAVPTATDDASGGYEVGSVWVATVGALPIPIPPIPPGILPAPILGAPATENQRGTSRVFVCAKATEGAAVWLEVGFAGYTFNLGDAAPRGSLFTTSQSLALPDAPGEPLRSLPQVTATNGTVDSPAGYVACLNHAGYLPGIIFPAQIRGIGIVGKDVLIAANKAAGREAIAAAGRQNDVVVIDDATFSPDDSHAGKVLVFTNGSGCALSIPLPTAADRQTGAASTKAIVWTAVAPGPEGNQIGIYTEGNNPSGETDVEEVAGSIKIRKSNRARISIDAGDMAVSGTPQVVPILLFDGEVDGMPSYSSGVGGWTAVYDSGDDELDLISPSGDKWSIPVGGLFAYPDQIPDHSQWVPVTTNATGAPSGITALTSSAGQVKDAADAASLTLVTASLVGDGSGSFDDLDPAVLLTGGEGTSSGFNFKIVPRGGDVTLSVDAAEDLNGVTGGSGVISQGFKELRFLTQAEGDHMVFGDIGAIS